LATLLLQNQRWDTYIGIYCIQRKEDRRGRKWNYTIEINTSRKGIEPLSIEVSWSRIALQGFYPCALL
jgi:hypothetical protein